MERLGYARGTCQSNKLPKLDPPPLELEESIEPHVSVVHENECPALIDEASAADCISAPQPQPLNTEGSLPFESSLSR
jgi:hypothetical protein